MVFIQQYNQWFEIIKRDGNYALINFNNSLICYNILGLEVKEKQQKLF